MNRWIALVVSAAVCWSTAMGCKGSGAPTEAPPLGPGESVPAPKSLFIPVTASGETQVYRVDIEPAEDANGALKTTPAKPKIHGYQAKSPIAAHLKHDSKGSVIGISPFNEFVLGCMALGAADAGDCADRQARLVGKDTTVDILKNRKLKGFIPFYYDDIGDRILFVVAGDDGVNHLMQRGMDGKESELYQDKDLYLWPGIGHVAYLFGSQGVFALTMADGKITRLSEPDGWSGGLQIVNRNGDYVLLQKEDKSQLVKSDGAKAYDLPSGAHARFFRPDLDEFVFAAVSTGSASPAKTTLKVPMSLYRLDLQSGQVTTLYNDDLKWILDHVGDQYLVGTPLPGKGQNSVRFSWLKPDGSLQDIVNVPTAKDAKVVSYNLQNQTVLIQEGTSKNLILASMKDGKVAATMDNVDSLHPILIFPLASIDMPLLVIAQKGGAPGSFNIGLISPDTLGGASGAELVPVALGTIDTKGAGAHVSQQILVADIRDGKTRTPAAVADTTPAPEPEKPKCIAQCDGKQCGEDGCGGSCGPCGDGKTCNAENKCVETAKTVTTIAASNFQATEALVIGNGVMKTANGETPKVTVKSDAPPKSVYIMCGSNIEPYLVQKFVLSPDPNDPASYALDISGIKPEILASPKFVCTNTVLDADGKFQFLKLKLVVK